MTERLDRQIAFLNEADKLKSVTRATELCDNSRYENSAEHSWHLTLYALVLADQAGPGVRDDLRVIWEEFEAAATPTAQFAKSLDRFQPPMQNLQSGGGSWVDYDVTEKMIADRVGSKIAIGAPALWDYAKGKITAFFEARAKT